MTIEHISGGTTLGIKSKQIGLWQSCHTCVTFTCNIHYLYWSLNHYHKRSEQILQIHNQT